MKNFKIKKKKTQRGFRYYEFKDRYGETCTLQESSLATEAAIWFGIDDVKPRIMVSDAKKLGLKTTEQNGWMDYPLPDEAHIGSRMHLTIEQVEALIPILQQFVKTGYLLGEEDLNREDL